MPDVQHNKRPQVAGQTQDTVEEKHYDAAFDILQGCTPYGKEVYSVPMEMFTVKLVEKHLANPAFCYLAKVDKVLEYSQKVGRMLLKYGDSVFEAMTGHLEMPADLLDHPFVICFSPRIAVRGEDKDVVFDMHGITMVRPPIEHEDDDCTDYDNIARDLQDLDEAVREHEATT